MAQFEKKVILAYTLGWSVNNMLTWSWLCSGRGYALFHQICISSPQPTGSKEVSTYEHQTNMSSTTKTSQRAYLTEFNMRIITMSINGPQHIIDRPPYVLMNLLIMT